MKGILLTEDLEPLVQNGGLVVEDSTFQNQKILILAQKGEIKEYPMRGVGARTFLETETSESLAREIRTEFTIDGMTVNQIKITESNGIEVEAFYQ